ncbi:probable glutamate receptor [Saccostrea echinata]|uniref:probable glutamate receptor n=1 Tax=Saccostrea echinata TaxID=191078 RepID=UPI002A81EFBB|nr:probable glutamate receptor [Saccostrea echinata]
MTSSKSTFNSEYFESSNLSPAIEEFKEEVKVQYRTNFTIEVKDEFNCNENNSTTDIFFLTALQNSLKQIKLSFSSVTDVYSTNGNNRSLDKVAEYSENLKIYDQRLFKNIFKDFGNQSLSVAFVAANPYIKKSIDAESGKVVYSGFCYDILEDLAKALNFRYHIKDSVDGLYGNPTDDFSNATGMVGMVMRGEADIAIGPFTITAARLKVVDFLTPFQEEGIGFMMRKIDSPPLEQMFHVFRPFSLVCWVAVVVSIVLTGIILSIIAKLSPYAEHKERMVLDPDSFRDI